MVLQQRRNIQASVSKLHKRGGLTSSSSSTLACGLAIVLGCAAVVALGLYWHIVSSLIQYHQQQQQQKPTLDLSSSSSSSSSSARQAQDSKNSQASGAQSNGNNPPTQQQQQLRNSIKAESSEESAQNGSKSIDAAAAAVEVMSIKDRKHKKEVLQLQTRLGLIQIVLRPDLAPDSTDYIHRVVQHIEQSSPDKRCPNCRLYRAEKPGILQGILRHPDIPISDKLGDCPSGYDNVANECPPWDKNCQCHGPIMTKGMVGWAAGQSGPDFFIDNYKQPAKWWGTQHTVWGEIQDSESFALIDRIWDLPVEKDGGLTMLKDPIHFDLALITSSSEEEESR